jgi:hypothetical protein
MFRFSFDDIVVSDPVNWVDFSETLEHDNEIKGVLPKYENRLKFSGGGYDYIYKKYLSDGYCTHVKFKVDQSCAGDGNFIRVFEGIVFVKDCKFNLNKCTVECEIEDNNYGARVYNNKSIKVYVDTVLTKNGETLVPVPSTLVYMFDPVDGSLIPDRVKTYSIYDCFRFIIDFMTDNLVGFESDYLQAAFVKQFYITTGGLIRKPTDITMPPELPLISFEMMFKEVNKKYPIAFTVVNRNGKPTIKIENEDYFYSQNTSGAYLKDIQDLHQLFNNEVLYSSVKFGGPSVPVDVTKHHFAFDKFRSFKEEEYFFTGECNIDKKLDLYADWVADSNIIEELVVTNTSNSSYDTQIFIVQQQGGFAVNQANPITGADPYYYNSEFTNDQVSLRQKAVEMYLQDNVLGFRASLSAEQLGPGLFLPPPYASVPILETSGEYQVQFNQDSALPNYDTTGNYNTSLWRYTAAQQGSYAFETGIGFIKDSPNNPVDSGLKIEFHIVFRRYNSSNVIVETNDVNCGTFNFDGGYEVKAAANFNLSVGDYVIVVYYHIRSRLSSVPIGFVLNIVAGSWFRNISSPTAAVRPSYGINKPYLASMLQFEYPISNETYFLIKQDLSKSIIVSNGDGRNRECWIRNISRNYNSSMAQCELITDIVII